LHRGEAAATAPAHTHLLEHATAAKATSETSAEEVVVEAERISLSLLASLSVGLLASTHHAWEAEVIIIVEEVGEGVTSPKEPSKNVVGICKRETTSASTSLEELRMPLSEATSSALLQASLAVLVVDFAFVFVGQNRVRLSDFLKDLTCFLLVIWIFVLKNQNSVSCSRWRHSYLQGAT